jgi:uncharacterized protein YeaO (DUF488 family)
LEVVDADSTTGQHAGAQEKVRHAGAFLDLRPSAAGSSLQIAVEDRLGELRGARSSGSVKTMPIDVVRVYGESRRYRGEYRVLVDRLWPRGLKKEAVDCDEWTKDVAPSTELRRWYGHDPQRFVEFSRRYRKELSRPSAAAELSRLRGIAAKRRLVLLTATRAVEYSGAAVLRTVLEGRDES